MDRVLRDIQLTKLTERAKELKCIYSVIEILKSENGDLADTFTSIIDAIPPGWQHPTVCEARIFFEGREFKSADFMESPWMQRAELVIDNHVSGEINVCYTQNVQEADNPFLPEEQKLLKTIAERLGQHIFYQRLKKSLDFIQSSGRSSAIEDDKLLVTYESDEHWKWRYHVSQKIADVMDFDRFGVEGVYLIGSTKNATAGPASDIDLMVHFRGNEKQLNELKAWIEGWGLGLNELNYIKTGYLSKGSLIDFHIITDEDIKKKTSYAIMIGSMDNPAQLLRSKSN